MVVWLVEEERERNKKRLRDGIRSDFALIVIRLTLYRLRWLLTPYKFTDFMGFFRIQHVTTLKKTIKKLP